MPVTYLPSSTLSEAVDNSVNTFTVAATTNITVGDLLAFRNEVMQVRDIPVSGRVVVRRGYGGTRALAHASGDPFYIGTGDEFASIRDQANGIFAPGQPLPNICIPGVVGVDGQGYEYQLVDLTASIVYGATVVISRDGNYTAAVLSTAGSGPVGITMEGGTSDQWVWVLRRGLHPHAKLVIGSSLHTSLGAFQAATSVSTPSVGLLGRSSSQRSSDATDATIMGMFPVSAATTASTATCTSETGFYTTVWLERPYAHRVFTS